jgi:ADP-heptose:LPS heptosyltransferase
MRTLKNTTLVCIDCYSYGGAVHAIQQSIQQIGFERVIFLTDIQLQIEGIEVVQIPRISSKKEYSAFVIKELYKYIPTDYFCVIQADGYIINGEAWDDEYYRYDYIGAPWVYDFDRQIGNGGSSFRNRRLHEILANDPLISVLHPEDQSICIVYKYYLEEKYGIKFAPVELAEKYSYELRQPNQPTFSFHGNFHPPYKPYIVIKRSGALGDCVLMEPVLKHFHKAGYNVVVDMPVYLYDLFKNHYFPVYHKSQIDWGRITPEKVINLDMAYEVKPHQNYLQSYFEMCGIESTKLCRPKLWPQVDENTKPFKKYCVIHIDEREQDERNVQISDDHWQDIILQLSFEGYQAIQIGTRDRKVVGLEYHTATIAHVKWLIAGADLFMGVDSGMSHIAMAMNIPSVIFFGSVDPHRIHSDHENMVPLQSPCDKQHCWHINGGTAGQACAYKNTEQAYQCTKLSAKEVMAAVYKITK